MGGYIDTDYFGTIPEHYLDEWDSYPGNWKDNCPHCHPKNNTPKYPYYLQCSLNKSLLMVIPPNFWATNNMLATIGEYHDYIVVNGFEIILNPTPEDLERIANEGCIDWRVDGGRVDTDI